MRSALQLLPGLAVLALLIWLTARFLWRCLKRSDDPGILLVRWVITALALAFIVCVAGREMLAGGLAALAGFLMALVAGLVLALTWTPSIAASFGRFFGDLYDGGSTPADPEPFFSIAKAKRKQGHYAEAVAEVQVQLERFPTNFDGWMLLAEIQAENLHDLTAAEGTIGRLLEQGGHAPKNVAFALTSLADWHLKFQHDPHSARRALEKILSLCPDSMEAHFAGQRLAHLPTAEMLAAASARAPLALPHGEARLGLITDTSHLKPKAADPAQRAGELVAQLNRYPWDNQTREELAVLYAQETHRLDLAEEQLEQLIAQPHVPSAQVIHWLNVKADLQLSEAGDVEAARSTLGRILEHFPNTAAAETAQRRLATLRLEIRAKQETSTFALAPARRLDEAPEDPPPSPTESAN